MLVLLDVVVELFKIEIKIMFSFSFQPMPWLRYNNKRVARTVQTFYVDAEHDTKKYVLVLSLSLSLPRSMQTSQVVHLLSDQDLHPRSGCLGHNVQRIINLVSKMNFVMKMPVVKST